MVRVLHISSEEIKNNPNILKFEENHICQIILHQNKLIAGIYFSTICAAVPTPKDDLFMGRYVYPVIEILALNVGRAKEKAGDAVSI